MNTTEHIVVAGTNKIKLKATTQAFQNQNILVESILGAGNAHSEVPEQPIHRRSWFSVHAPIITKALVSLPKIGKLADRFINGVNEGKVGASNRAINAGKQYRTDNPHLADKEEKGEVRITEVGIENYLEIRPNVAAPIFKAVSLFNSEWYNKQYDAGRVERGYDKAAIALRRDSQTTFTFSEEVEFPAHLIRESIEGGREVTVGNLMASAGIVSDNANPHKDLSGKDRIDFLIPAVEQGLNNVYSY
jgi:hypothetical protein